MSTRRRCAWCGRAFVPSSGPGRPRRYCKPSHRQRAYEARRVAAARGLGPDEVVLRRDDWRRLQDERYRLETILEDARTDLADDPGALRQAFEALEEAAAALVRLDVEPIAHRGL